MQSILGGLQLYIIYIINYFKVIVVSSVMQSYHIQTRTHSDTRTHRHIILYQIYDHVQCMCKL